MAHDEAKVDSPDAGSASHAFVVNPANIWYQKITTTQLLLVCHKPNPGKALGSIESVLHVVFARPCEKCVRPCVVLEDVPAPSSSSSSRRARRESALPAVPGVSRHAWRP